MSVTTKVQREEPTPVFDGRDAYLSRKPICQVMRTEFANAGRASLPWLTPVLGSGCSATSGQLDAVKSAIARVVALVRPKPPFPFLLDYETLPEVVCRHATDLAEDRLRLARGSLGDIERQDKEGDEGLRCVADLFVASVLLTKLFYEIKARGVEAPRRAGHDDQVVLHTGLNHYLHLRSTYADPLLARAKDVGAAASSLANVLVPPKDGFDPTRDAARHQVKETIAVIVERLVRRLEKPPTVLGLVDLQAVSEVAWLSLTAEPMVQGTTPMYPGWGDLLLDLSNFDNAKTPLGARVGLPGFDSMKDAQDFIRIRYADATRRAYAMDRAAPSGATRSPVHAAAARVLVAEYEYWRVRRRQSGFPGEPPLASAFVTSFDMEFELALLRSLRGSENGRFVIALPAFLYDQESRLARALWLSLDVDSNADDPLEQLLKPDAGRLSVLGDRVRDQLDNGSSEHGPIVVRLAGCPLVQLPTRADNPELFEQLERTFEGDLNEAAAQYAKWLDPDQRDADPHDVIRAGLTLHHAVIINEHEAMLQNATDLLDFGPPVDDSMTSDPPAPRRGLPPQVAAGRPNWTRFWMLLGVQFAHSAVRHRIATLVSLLPRGVASADPGQHHGVAVNRVIGLLEQELLFWNGFAVVKDHAEAFAEDLDHYHDHMARLGDHAGAKTRVWMMGDCQVVVRT